MGNGDLQTVGRLGEVANVNIFQLITYNRESLLQSSKGALPCFKAYISATNDTEFMLHYGAEVLFETARAWIELGTWQAGTFQIHGVTGPDEVLPPLSLRAT